MNKKLIIFDMDGTVYLGANLIDGALDAFDYLKKNNIEYVFFTNNSSHDLEFYEKKVKNFGIECSLKDKLKKHFTLIDKYSENEEVDAVVAGFSTELVYQELKDACLYLETRDIPLIATNGDYRCPIEDGLYIPDCGGMCEWIRLCTGKTATVLGKPNPEIIYYLAKQFNVSLDEVLVVGDRLYTDILVGVNAKVDSLCVLSGESSLEDVKSYPHKPTYILKSIKELPDLLGK